MSFSMQALPLIAATVMTLIAGDVREDDPVTDARTALSNRELAATGLAISVTVRGGSECGAGDAAELSDEQQHLRQLFSGSSPFTRSDSFQSSGVILSADGEVLSLSLPQSCSSYQVTLPDGREVTALPVGFDSMTDLTLLRVETTGLTAARIGDPNDLRPGDRVLAFGSPFGMEQTLSAGLVSTNSRYLPDNPGNHYIQSDAMINPGSAGGPLLNEYGEVVGMHAMLLTQGRNFDGMSFALPADIAMRVVEDLREFGRVQRAWLGVMAEKSPAAEAGAVVVEIEPDSPMVGVAQLGDRIVAVDGEPVATPDELRRLIQKYRAGASVSLTLVRDDNTVNLALTLGERPE